MIESEQCLKQQTGSCESCPVLYLLRDALRNNYIGYDTRTKSYQSSVAAEISQESCPEGQIPDIDQLIVESKGNGWTGRYLTINIR